MNKCFFLITKLIIVLLVYKGAIAATLPPEMHSNATNCLKNVYSENFKNAKIDAKNIIKVDPRHPAGYFFYAAVLNAEMDYLQSEKYESEFYKYCDLAIEKGEKLLETSDDVWVKFFTAGASGFKGAYESRCERWVTAFKQGWRGVAMFKEMLEDGVKIKDVEYGIATYDYWRSAKTKALWWMPGVKDKRDESIATLSRLVKEGVYVKESSAYNLCNIFIDHGDYKDAELLADEMLKMYPGNLSFTYQKTLAQIKQNKFLQAKKGIAIIKKRLSENNFPSNYNTVMLNYFILNIQNFEKKYGAMKPLYKSTMALSLSDVSKDRLKNYFSEIDSLMKDSRKVKK